MSVSELQSSTFHRHHSDWNGTEIKGTSTPHISSPDKVNRLHRTRKHLVEELITSEVKYLDYLRKIIQYFSQPIMQGAFLPADIHAEIFGRIHPIICVNETLLECMLTMGVEEAFLLIAPCLKLYADYARRYQTSLVLLETCETFNPDLYNFIVQQENVAEVNLQLSALLIMPIQRIPRYSLLLQELLLVHLQLDGLSYHQAHGSIGQLLTVTQDKSAMPEQINACILSMHECALAKQPYVERIELDSSLLFLGHFMHRFRHNTVRLLAAFAFIASTSTYLNEHIRDASQADLAALLQSRLLGRWTDNLLLVPGRRLLRCGLVSKENQLNNRREWRLLILLSDLLIVATPQKVQYPPVLKKPKKLRRIARIPPSRKSIRSKHRQHRKSCLRRKSVQNVWLESVAQPNLADSVFSDGNPIEFLVNKKVRFPCIAVFPLHHCTIQPLFTVSGNVQDWRQPLDDRSVCLSNISVFKTQTTLPLHEGHCDSSLWSPDRHHLNQNDNPTTSCVAEENAFTINCLDKQFTAVMDSREAAEDWFICIETAILAVQMARQSLRKASSAKRPMEALDFVRYEQWVQGERNKTECSAIPEDEPTDANSIIDSLGLGATAKENVCLDHSCGIASLTIGKLRSCSLPFTEHNEYTVNDPINDVNPAQKFRTSVHERCTRPPLVSLTNVLHEDPYEARFNNRNISTPLRATLQFPNTPSIDHNKLSTPTQLGVKTRPVVASDDESSIYSSPTDLNDLKTTLTSVEKRRSSFSRCCSM